MVVAGCAALVVGAGVLMTRIGAEFLPTFNEGTAVVTLAASPGLSLAASDQLGRTAEELLLEIPEVRSVARRTGRAEQDEHALGVHVSEIEVDFWREGQKPGPHDSRMPPADPRRRTVFADVRDASHTFPASTSRSASPSATA